MRNVRVHFFCQRTPPHIHPLLFLYVDNVIVPYTPLLPPFPFSLFSSCTLYLDKVDHLSRVTRVHVWEVLRLRVEHDDEAVGDEGGEVREVVHGVEADAEAPRLGPLARLLLQRVADALKRWRGRGGRRGRRRGGRREREAEAEGGLTGV